MDYKRIVTSDPSMTVQEKAQRVLELYDWLKESKETDEVKAVFYAAKQAQKKYQFSLVQAYQYCADSAKCYDAELEACVSFVDALRSSIQYDILLYSFLCISTLWINRILDSCFNS